MQATLSLLTWDNAELSVLVQQWLMLVLFIKDCIHCFEIDFLLPLFSDSGRNVDLHQYTCAKHR